MDNLWQFVLISACCGEGELPVAVLLTEAEGELEAPGVAAAAEDGGGDAAASGEGGVVAAKLHVELFSGGAIVVQRAVEDGVDILLLRLPHAGHVDEHEVVGDDAAERRAVLLYHRTVHQLIELFYRLLVGCLCLCCHCRHNECQYCNKMFHLFYNAKNGHILST